MKTIIGRIILVIAGVTLPVLLLIAFVATFGGMENYCWWNPWIDTKCTPQYSESNFDHITPGMTEAEVVGLLGQPFSKGAIPKATYSYMKPTTSRAWLYTGDGKCTWGDWAWMGRWVDFDDDGRVTETLKIIHHD